MITFILSLDSMNDIVFVHVNKCGGRSLNECLFRYCRDNGIRYRGLVGRPVTRKTPGRLVLFVRDPIERFISSYWYYRRNHVLPPLDELLDLMSSNPGYCADMMRRNLHFGYGFSWYVGFPLPDFWFIGYQDSMKEDVVRLMGMISDKGGYRLEHLNRTRRLGVRLSDKHVRFLRGLYENDYKILNALPLDVGWLDRVNNRMEYFY
jgi:hypothetical protein